DQRHHRRGSPGAARTRLADRHGPRDARDLRGQHQRVRRIRRDPSDAEDVHARHDGEDPVVSALVDMDGAVQAAYVASGALFIVSLAGLSRHRTARDGNTLGVVGMGIALVATITATTHHGVSPLALTLMAAAIG